MAAQFFPYRFDHRWKALFITLRVGEYDGVTVDPEAGTFRATFGRCSVETPLDNIAHTQVTSDHRWYTALGLRLSAADDGVTFGTNHRVGLCIEFVEKIPKVIGLRKHSALWVSVDDPDGLAAATGR